MFSRPKAFIGFAGFGGPDIALREAGFETTGVEIDPAIAEVNRVNGGNVITADILTIDPTEYIGYDLGHFSLPCTSFSLAKQGEETELDKALARWVARFIVIAQPEYFTLENVWKYRNSKSWAIILEALTGMGYGVDWWHLNAADYGVPQTRKRMIAIARFDGRPPTKPRPTHRDPGKDSPGQLSLFDDRLPPWVGWYEAIADLIPTLPESEFAPWQMDRMPDELKTFLAPVNGEGSTGFTADRPAPTIAAGHSNGKYRAFLAESQNGSHDILTIRNWAEPANTVVASFARRPAAMPKAFIIDCQNNGSPDKRGLTIRQSDQPCFTMTASANRPTIRAGLQSGRTVSMTPRALARFQGFPDWYKLPGELPLMEYPDLGRMLLDSDISPRALACRGIGNAVPPAVYRAKLKSLFESEE